MDQRLEDRLKTLEEEFKSGQQVLAELETRAAAVRNSLLRLSGAIQVLRELLPNTTAPQPGVASGDGAMTAVR